MVKRAELQSNNVETKIYSVSHIFPFEELYENLAGRHQAECQFLHDGIKSSPIFRPQALVEGGLASLADDPHFVSTSKREMADAMRTTVDDMESVAQGILGPRSASAPAAKKRRPVPVPPTAPSVAAPASGAKPDPSVRRKRRPVPTISSVQKPHEPSSNV